MTSPRSLALVLLFTACTDRRPPAPPLPPAKWTPLPPPTSDPVSTTSVQPEFWKQGQAACPEGATFTASTPPYFQASCTADGVIHGPTATFDAEGHLLALEYYERGKAEGLHTSYWPNGARKQERSWHLGREHGPFKRWHANGQVAEQGAWIDGRLDGKILAFDASGRPLGTSELIRGTGLYTEWTDAGTRASERNFVDGLEHGHRTEWHPDGRKSIESEYVHGVQHGRFAAWDERGKPLRIGQYANDRETGTWTFYTASGDVDRVDTYDDGDVIRTVLHHDGKPLGKPAADDKCATKATIAAVYQAQTGSPLGDGDAHCVRPALHFPGVVAIGDFAHDRGCAGDDVLVDCKYMDTPDGAAILARAGWQKATPATRELLARYYVDEVALAWSRSGEASVERQPSGDLHVTGTVSYTGMRGSVSYRETFRVTPAGKVVKLKSP
jgi:antitoxin component YwqK of YwqJK toxin-antitoxin module